MKTQPCSTLLFDDGAQSSEPLDEPRRGLIESQPEIVSVSVTGAPNHRGPTQQRAAVRQVKLYDHAPTWKNGLVDPQAGAGVTYVERACVRQQIERGLGPGIVIGLERGEAGVKPDLTPRMLARLAGYNDPAFALADH